MSNDVARKGATLRFASEFNCIGADCPDTCCAGWNIDIAPPVYEKLKKVLPASVIKQNLTVNKSITPNQNDTFIINLSDDGKCPFLDRDDSLCTIQKKYGESYLGDTCRKFPRRISLVGDTTELGLSLSCPEAARLCLLNESATDVIAFNPDSLYERNFGLAYSQPASPLAPYLTYINDIREIMMRLIGVPEFPVASNLFVAAYFANQVSPILNIEATEIDDAAIGRILDRLIGPGFMQELHKEFGKISCSSDLSLSIVQGLILERMTPGLAITSLITNALENYGMTFSFSGNTVHVSAVNGSLVDNWEGMIKEYQSRRDSLMRKYGSRLNQYFTNYCRNFWFYHPFVLAISPLHHMHDLALRVAVISFLFFSQPELNDLCNENIDSSQADLELLDELAVKVFYLFSRGIEQTSNFMPMFRQKMDEQEMNSFAHLVMLLKF